MGRPAKITITGPEKAVSELGSRQAVVLSLEAYQSLLQRIEDLEDVADSLDALKEYKTGAGIPLNDYLAERQTPFHHPSSPRTR
jgi:hypothetical protein